MSDHFPKEHGEPPHFRGPEPTDPDENVAFVFLLFLGIATVVAFLIIVNIVSQTPKPPTEYTPVPTADYSVDATATP